MLRVSIAPGLGGPKLKKGEKEAIKPQGRKGRSQDDDDAAKTKAQFPKTRGRQSKSGHSQIHVAQTRVSPSFVFEVRAGCLSRRITEDPVDSDGRTGDGQLAQGPEEEEEPRRGSGDEAGKEASKGPGLVQLRGPGNPGIIPNYPRAF
ncbi:hypothetical protein KM043_008369 [Ampulex compressa]|nr:hypothetical protein KM043_008369 [Ampulex compressa]